MRSLRARTPFRRGPPRSPEAEPSPACLRVQLHTLLGNDVYKTYRAESAARHSEAAAKHKEQGTAAPGAPQASAPSQVSAHPAASSSTCILTR